MRRQCSTAIAALFLSASAGLEASTVMQLNLGEMVQRADLIYRGTVLSVQADTVEVGGGRLPVTVYKLRVDESFRGEFTEVKGMRIAELRTLGKLETVRSGDLQSSAVLPHMPVLAVGQAYLVLTTRPSAIGLSATVGLGQGCFKILQVGKDETAVNEANNSGLFRDMPEPAAPLAARSALAPAAAAKGSLAYSDLADRIRGLVAR